MGLYISFWARTQTWVRAQTMYGRAVIFILAPNWSALNSYTLEYTQFEYIYNRNNSSEIQLWPFLSFNLHVFGFSQLCWSLLYFTMHFKLFLHLYAQNLITFKMYNFWLKLWELHCTSMLATSPSFEIVKINLLESLQFLESIFPIGFLSKMG